MQATHLSRNMALTSTTVGPKYLMIWLSSGQIFRTLTANSSQIIMFEKYEKLQVSKICLENYSHNLINLLDTLNGESCSLETVKSNGQSSVS